MKRLLPLLLGVAFMVFTMAACEGDEGPAGPAGPAGPQGPPGTPGDPGQNALNTCVECHNNDTQLMAVEMQYGASPHFNNVYWYRTGSCMACHTHNGFITAAVNGEALPGSYENPVPINCRTCHNIHTDFTADDYALTTTAAVDLIVGDTFDIGGAGNLCANCHQSRSISPMPVIDGDPVTVGNFRYGPHYAPQANVLIGEGMFEFEGSLSYDVTTPHQADCNACHMVAAVYDGDMYVAGGHVFGLSYGEGGEAIAACTQCHSSATSFNAFNGQANTQALMDDLAALLTDAGILDAENYAVPGTYPANVAAAFLNYKFIYHDGSLGVHNPHYVRAILTNTIEALQPPLN